MEQHLGFTVAPQTEEDCDDERIKPEEKKTNLKAIIGLVIFFFYVLWRPIIIESHSQLVPVLNSTCWVLAKKKKKCHSISFLNLIDFCLMSFSEPWLGKI